MKVQLGPQVGYFVTGNSEITGSESGSLNGEGGDLELDNKFDYGVNLGLAYHFTDKFFVEAVYYYGLKNVTANPDSDFDNSNFFFQLNLAYSIF